AHKTQSDLNSSGCVTTETKLLVHLKRCGLLGLRTGDADDLAPFLGFSLHEGSKVGAEGGAWLGAELADARADLRTLDDLFGLLNEPSHPRGWRARRRHQAEP